MSKTFLPQTYERVDARGRFVELLAEGTWEAVIHGEMHAGAVLGNQYHRLTRVYVYLVSGAAEVDLVDVSDGTRDSVRLSPGKGVFIEPGLAHAVRFSEPSEFILAKSRKHDPLDADSYPYEIVRETVATG